MIVSSKHEVEVTLVLTQKEAEWLREVVRNPVGVDYESEPLHDREMRSRFYHALDGNLPQVKIK